MAVSWYGESTNMTTDKGYGWGVHTHFVLVSAREVEKNIERNFHWVGVRVSRDMGQWDKLEG